MKLCLNMIVKNEGARIVRAIKSAGPWIDSFVIVDTGSTDDTKQQIIDYFEGSGVIGEIRDAPFEDWSQARNAALNLARQLAFAYQPDYFLLMDADMELVVKDAGKFTSFRTGPSYDFYQQAGGTHYQNRRLVHAKVMGQYIGRTHEYLDIASAGLIDEDVAYFIDHSDGANRPGKFKRDIRLLTADLKDRPDDGRTLFYLGCSLRDAGKPERAAHAFKRRVEVGGWDEEVWQAQVNYAHCLKDTGDEAGFVAGLLKAYHMRPHRAESMYDLARFYREKGMNAPALAAAEAVDHLPVSKDALFVNNYVYQVGVKQEISISGFYVPGKKARGFEACNALALNNIDHGAREEARSNLIHYVEPLVASCPSFKWANIDFTAPADWTAMNPSVAMHDGRIKCNVRCVNYRIDDQGRYLIRGTDGTANGENPIRTRNFLLDMGLARPHIPPQAEILDPLDMPCEWNMVMGFEDIRLISCAGNLLTSSTVRQLCADGNCEQVLTRLMPGGAAAGDPIVVHTDMHRMLREPRQTQKNWAPLVELDEPLRFMYRPLELVDTNGVTVRKHDTGFDTGNISGSSQLIFFRHGWLAVTHEARFFQGTSNRYYLHRFAWYNEEFTKVKFSLPFFFNDKGIEFCAGMCWDPDGVDLVISYGYKDCEARIGRVSATEVEHMLWPARSS